MAQNPVNRNDNREPNGSRPPGGKPWGRRILIGIAAFLALLLILAAGLYLWLGTDAGRRFVARQVEELAFENGLQIGVGRIEGSVFGAMRIHDMVLRDASGVFLTAPIVELDWRPIAYARNHIDIRALIVPRARLYRVLRSSRHRRATNRCCPMSIST